MLTTDYGSVTRNGLVLEIIGDGNVLDTNDGTKSVFANTNGTFVTSDIGYQKQCLNFGGTAYINNASFLDSGLSSWTASFWFNTTQTTGALFLDKEGSGTGYPLLIGIGNPSAGRLMIIWSTGAGANQISTVNSYNDGKWHHCVCYGDSSGRTSVKIEIDGVIDYTAISSSGTDSGSIVAAPGTKYPFTIGRRHFSADNYLTGKMGSIRLYNYILSNLEKQNLRFEGLRQMAGGSLFGPKGPLNGCVAYYDVDVGATSVVDLISGLTTTRVGGTNTTDMFGISKAITNPNYTWSSITYTDSVLIEYNGSAWVATKNSTGVSATGINKTTTMSKLLLFNRTVSTEEVTAIQLIIQLKYLIN